MRMQSAWRMQRWVHGVMLLSVWYRTIRLMSSCCASQPDRRYSWILMDTEDSRDEGYRMTLYFTRTYAHRLRNWVERVSGNDNDTKKEYKQNSTIVSAGKCLWWCLIRLRKTRRWCHCQTHLSKAEAPRRSLIMSLVNRRVGPASAQQWRVSEE